MPFLRTYRLLIFLSTAFGLVLKSFGQYDERDFTRYSVKDGLSDNPISCIQQDDQGYLWIGTDAGLNRFDGKNFKKFYQSTAPIHLPSGSITNMKRFGSNELGIISRGGFQILNTKNYSVRNFYVPDSTSFISYSNAAWDAIQLRGQRYAVSTASGIYVFDQSGKVVFRYDGYSIKDVGKKRILYARDFFPLNEKQILVYTDDSGLGMYDDEKKTYQQLNRSNPAWEIFHRSGKPDSTYWVVKHQLNPDEYFFIANSVDRIGYYDRRKNRLIISPLPKEMFEAFNWESRIVKLTDSSYAVNSRVGGFYLLHFDSKSGKFQCDGQPRLRNYKIMALFVDRDNRLWVGTTKGLLKQDQQEPFFHTYEIDSKGGENFTGGIGCFYKYKDKLYAGRFSRNKGLAIIDAATMQLIGNVDLFGPNNQWNEVRTIEMYYPDTLWIGTNAGIIWYAIQSGKYGKLHDDPRYKWAENFSAVLSAPRSDGYAWMCSMLDGKLIRYHIPGRTHTLFTAHTKPALPFNKIKHVVYDSYGDVWVGGHSLARWNSKLQDFDTLITVYGGANKFNDDIIFMRADDQGSIWIHNAYNGLLEYKVRDKKFIAYSTRDGLGTDVLGAMSPVYDNKLWVAGNNKLNYFDTRTKEFTVYDMDDGLPEQYPTGKRIYFDQPSGLLYMGYDQSIVRFSFLPEGKKDLSSGLIIEELKLDNQGSFYQPARHLKLKHNQNNLQVDFSVIDFEKSNYQFAYRLDEGDDWIVIGNQRTLVLNSLNPGAYDLQIKASGKPGIEKTATLSFEIQNPLWKRSWFIGLAVLLLATGTYFLYRYRIRQVRQRADLDNKLSQMEMKALQAQINPHFIFNSLNSIRQMILSDKKNDASLYLGKFAHLIRVTLDQSSQALVSLRNTLDHLERYLEMEKIRNSVFTYSIHVDEQLDPDDTYLPPMLLQPFIENALWHGVTAHRKDIHVQLDFSKQGQSLVCRIEDNGIGINQAQKNKSASPTRYKSHGISNIRTRVSLLNEKYNLHSLVNLQDKKDVPGNGGTGTVVTLSLPLEISES